MTLGDHWQRTWKDLKRPPPPTVFEQIAARYTEPSRAYHTLRHLEECFDHFVATRQFAAEPGEIQLALWFHDAIYDTRRDDNEEQSAKWARQVLADAGAPAAAQKRTQALILATTHNLEPKTADAKLTVDIDLSILGARPERFAEYENQIRMEYSWVDETRFREARGKILRQFLARQFIFWTPTFRERLEAQARSNVENSLGRLT